MEKQPLGATGRIGHVEQACEQTPILAILLKEKDELNIRLADVAKEIMLHSTKLNGLTIPWPDTSEEPIRYSEAMGKLEASNNVTMNLIKHLECCALLLRDVVGH